MNTPSIVPGRQLHRAILVAALELHSQNMIQFDEDQIDSTIEKINGEPIYSLRITLQTGLKHLIENELIAPHGASAVDTPQAGQQENRVYSLTEKGLEKAKTIQPL